MSVDDVVRSLVEPIAAAAGAEVYDVTMAAGKLTIAVTRSGGIDLDTVGRLSRQFEQAIDDEDPIVGAYTLEVTSPGLERTLRTAAHFTGAIGELVTLRTRPDAQGERRVRGVVESAGPESVVVVEEDGGARRSVAYSDIERARTVFTWGPTPKPGTSPRRSGAARTPSARPEKKAPPT